MRRSRSGLGPTRRPDLTERFDIKFPDRAVTLKVTDGVLASISNTYELESDGQNRYRDFTDVIVDVLDRHRGLVCI